MLLERRGVIAGCELGMLLFTVYPPAHQCSEIKAAFYHWSNFLTQSSYKISL